MDLACRRGFAPSFDESKRPLIARQVLQAILQAVGDRLRSPSVQLVDRYLDLKGAFPRATVVPNESSVGKPDRAQERRDVMGNAGRCAEAILVEMLGFEVGSRVESSNKVPGLRARLAALRQHQGAGHGRFLCCGHHSDTDNGRSSAASTESLTFRPRRGGSRRRSQLGSSPCNRRRTRADWCASNWLATRDDTSSTQSSPKTRNAVPTTRFLKSDGTRSSRAKSPKAISHVERAWGLGQVAISAFNSSRTLSWAKKSLLPKSSARSKAWPQGDMIQPASLRTASVSASRRSSWLASARARRSTFAQRVRGGTDLCRSSRIWKPLDDVRDGASNAMTLSNA